MSRTVILFVSMIFSLSLFGQSFWFGTKSGGALNWQSWGNGLGSGLNRQQLFSVPADIFIESYDEENKGSLYASLGYRVKGSSFRVISTFGDFAAFQGFKFRNLQLETGLKKGLNQEVWGMMPFYILGIRAEYNINTNLDDYRQFNNLFYPEDAFVKKFLYGFTAGGGLEKDVSEFARLFLEFVICPDVSFQYDQPQIFSVVDPFTRQTINLEERLVRNLSMEFKIGIKFLRKVEYID